MNILLHPVGSHGDVHPIIGLGRALAARGHSVTLVSLETFQSLAERNGFAFVPAGTDEDYQLAMNNPELWKPGKGLRVLFRNDRILRLYRLAYDRLAERIVTGETVILAGSLGFAARTLQEAHGVPLVTIHLQPSTIFSVDSPARYPGARPAWWPRWMRRAFFRFADFLGDRWIGAGLNEFRSSVGLPPVCRIVGQWMHSPDRVLGLFPTWYGTAPDWPPQMRQTGFVRYDQDEQPLDPAVERFLSAGDPPIVFSFGSAMKFGRPYFETAVEACRRLNRRGIILAKGGEQIPSDLPPTVAQFDYAPFSQVFPRAVAVVHHGGIGTTAQCFAAGVPQLVVPISFDQPDNASRVVCLGVGRAIPSRKFSPKRAARVLVELLSDAGVSARCREFRELMTAADPLPETCRLIEDLAGREVRPADVVSSDVNR
ncbi:MAG TPA: nucleotide disphospho-sugar-binding domain-containing protein [Fimbriiglobus sp.]